MTDINGAPVPVTTFVKRQRRISERINSKNQSVKEPSVVTELTFEDAALHDEKILKTPSGSSRKESSNDILEPNSAISPTTKLYFEEVDKEELLVEDGDSDDDN
jgi:hypothetical protein